MNNSGIKNGLFFGALAVGLYLIVYLINSRLLFSAGFGPIISIVIPVIFMVIAARTTRQNQGGIMTFGESLSCTFLTYVIGTFIYAIFSFLMSNIVDPSLLEIGKEVQIEAIDKVSGMLSMSEDQLDMMKEAVEEGANSGIGTILMGWAFSLIIPGFIIAAIISAIMKKNATV